MKKKYYKKNISKSMIEWMKILFPLNRSIAGAENFKTLSFLQKQLPNLKIKYFKSGKKVFDWVIPPEWNVSNAYVLDKNNLEDQLTSLHPADFSDQFEQLTSEQRESLIQSAPKLISADVLAELED